MTARSSECSAPSNSVRSCPMASRGENVHDRRVLAEVEHARQIRGEPFRRWFADGSFDLIVWYDERRSIIGFQLCYQSDEGEKALTWYASRGFAHHRVDDGEGEREHRKMTPVLVGDGVFDLDAILESFLAAGREIEPEIVGFVASRLRSYPAT